MSHYSSYLRTPGYDLPRPISPISSLLSTVSPPLALNVLSLPVFASTNMTTPNMISDRSPSPSSTVEDPTMYDDLPFTDAHSPRETSRERLKNLGHSDDMLEALRQEYNSILIRVGSDENFFEAFYEFVQSSPHLPRCLEQFGVWWERQITQSEQKHPSRTRDIIIAPSDDIRLFTNGLGGETSCAFPWQLSQSPHVLLNTATSNLNSTRRPINRQQPPRRSCRIQAQRTSIGPAATRSGGIRKLSAGKICRRK